MTILFYAWTDIQIINCINLKKTIYSNECADICIPKRSRISPSLIHIIEKEDIFHKYMIIDRMMMIMLIISCNPINISFMHHYGNVMWPFSLFHFPGLLASGKYSKIVVSGFWDVSLFIIHFLFSITKSLDIELIEEGLANYTLQKRDLGLFVERKFRILWAVFTLTSRSVLSRKYLSFTRKMYLYCPDAGVAKDIDLITLPMLESRNVPISTWDGLLSNVDVNIYRDAEVIYFVQDQVNNPTDYCVFCEEIYCISKVFGKHAIIKSHPSFPLNNILTFCECRVDNSRCPFEVLFATIDLRNVLLVTRNSSAVLSPRFAFHCTPPTIMTFKLYGSNLSKAILTCLNNSNEYSESILIPNNMDEFMCLLTSHKHDN